MDQGAKLSIALVYNTFFSAWLAKLLSNETRPEKEHCT